MGLAPTCTGNMGPKVLYLRSLKYFSTYSRIWYYLKALESVIKDFKVIRKFEWHVSMVTRVNITFKESFNTAKINNLYHFMVLLEQDHGGVWQTLLQWKRVCFITIENYGNHVLQMRITNLLFILQGNNSKILNNNVFLQNK